MDENTISQKKFRIGVIGCGKIAQVRHIPEYIENDNAELYGLYDINVQRAQDLANRYHCKAYPSVETMLKDDTIDAVSVCAANSSHAEITIAALNSGKHVLCEKPMATTIQECEAMVNASKETGKFLMIGHNQRLARAHVKAKELIDNGEIGKIITARSLFGHSGPENWSVDKGGGTWFFDKQKAAMGVLADLGIHKTDLLQYLCSSKIARVTARFATLDKRDNNGNLIPVDDNAICIYEMENSILCTMIASWTNYGEEDNSTVLYGTKGVMRIYDDPAHSIVVMKKNGEKYMYDVEKIQTNDNQTKSGIIDMWMNCLVNNEQPEISGENAMYAMRAVFTAIESNRTERTIAIK